MVNRIWQHHFGKGLVAHAHDFGKRGTPPTHPELLDYLAARFVDSGLVDQGDAPAIMLSETYQQAARRTPRTRRWTPTTIFCGDSTGSGSMRRPCAIPCLTISGELEPGPGGPHPFPHMGTWMFMQHDPFNAVYPSKRRSVYLMTQRIQRHPFLGMFDGADPAISTAQRPLTITPIQALFFMNSELVHQTAGIWAKHLTESQPSKRARWRTPIALLSDGAPTPEEVAGASQIFSSARKTLQECCLPGAGPGAGELSARAAGQ